MPATRNDIDNWNNPLFSPLLVQKEKTSCGEKNRNHVNLLAKRNNSLPFARTPIFVIFMVAIASVSILQVYEFASRQFSTRLLTKYNYLVRLLHIYKYLLFLLLNRLEHWRYRPFTICTILNMYDWNGWHELEMCARPRSTFFIISE